MATASLPQDGSRQEALRRVAVALEASADAIRLLADEDQPGPRPLDEDRMLTVPEAAALLKRSPSHIRAKCRSGDLKAMRDGQDWRIRQSAIAAYERRRTR